jgi:hypothetical protein
MQMSSGPSGGRSPGDDVPLGAPAGDVGQGMGGCDSPGAGSLFGVGVTQISLESRGGVSGEFGALEGPAVGVRHMSDGDAAPGGRSEFGVGVTQIS